MKKFLLLILFFSQLSAMGQVKRDLALNALEEGRYEDALTDFSSLYRQSGTDFYYDKVVECYLGMGEYRDAREFILNHIDRARNRSDLYRIDLGYMHAREGDSSSASEVFDVVIKAIERQPGLAYQYSERFKKWGFYNEALEALNVAERVNPNMAFDNQKALLYAEMGDLVKMYEAYLDALQKNPSFLSNLQNVIRFNMNREGEIPKSAELKGSIIGRIQTNDANIAFNKLLIWVLAQEGDFRAAFTQARALYRRGQMEPFEVLNLGNQAITAQEYGSAERIFNFVREEGNSTPYFADASFKTLRAQRLDLQQKSAPAEDFQAWHSNAVEMAQSLRGNTVYPDVLLEIAEVEFYRLQNPELALQTIEQIQKTTSPQQNQNAVSLLLRGEIELAIGRPYDAILTFARVETEMSTAPLGQEARYRKARVAFFTGEFDWALSMFSVLKTSTSKYIANDALRMGLLIKDNAALDTTFTFLGIYADALLLKERNRLDSALNILDGLDIRLRLSDDHPLLDESLFTRAEIHQQQQKWEEAAAEFVKVADDYPKDLLADQALLLAAQIYEEELNNPTRARELYERILTEHQNSIFTEDARKRFRALRGDLNS